VLPLPIKSDAQLVRRTLRGHRDAFSLLVERHQELVFAVAYGIVAHAADAEDVTQEAFLTAFDKLPSLREPAKFRAWLLTIARNRCADVVVKRRREAPLEDPDTTEAPAGDTLADAELRALLRERIERLPAEHREILLLHYYADLKTREIAVHLEISHEAAKKRLQRARDLLSQRMLVQLRDTVEEQGTSAARCKTIVAAIAGTSVAWQSAAVAAGAGIFSGVFVSKLGVAGLATVGVIAAVTWWPTEDVLPKEDVVSSVVAESPEAVDVTPPNPVGATEAQVPVLPVAAAPQRAEGERGGKLFGRVVNSDGDPQPFAVVMADSGYPRASSVPIEDQPIEHHETESDDAGKFYFDDLLVDTAYVLRAFTDSEAAKSRGKTGAAGEAASSIDMELAPAQPLFGMTVDPDGNPVPEVLIQPAGLIRPEGRVKLPHGWEQASEIISDASGRFVFPPMWAGDWYLRLAPMAHLQRRMTGVRPEASPYTITLEPGARVSGQVVMQGTGEGVAAVEVEMPSNRRTQADAHGFFQLEGVSLSSLNVRLREHESLLVVSPDFYVTAGQELTGVRIEVARGGFIRGYIRNKETGLPFTHGFVEFATGKLGVSFSAMADEKGSYVVGPLYPGSYQLESIDGSNHDLYGRYVLTGERDDSPIEIALGSVVDGVDFELERGRTISGRVVFPSDSIPDAVTVGIRRPSMNGSAITTEVPVRVDGSFAYTGFPHAGDALLQVSGGSWTSQKVGPLALEDGDLEGVALVATPVGVGRVRGRVDFGMTVPPPEVSIALYNQDTDVIHMTQAGHGGHFDFRDVAPGRYRAEFVERQVYSEVFDVRAGEESRGVVLAVQPVGTTIEGRVVDAQGRPVGGAEIRARGGEARIPRVRSDEAGKFRLYGVGEVPCRVSVSADGYESASRDAVAPGTRGIEFRLTSQGKVEGFLVNSQTGAPIEAFHVNYALGTSQAAIDQRLQLGRGTRRISGEGAFALEGVRPGTQTVVAQAPGYFPGQAAVTVAPGKTSEGVIVRMDPAPTFEATVVDAAGASVADARIYVAELPESWVDLKRSAGFVATDSEGRARLYPRMRGRNAMFVYHPQHGMGNFFLDAHGGRRDLRFELPPVGQLAGRVTLDQEAALRAQVSLAYAKGEGPIAHGTFTAEVDPDGYFLFEGMPIAPVTLGVFLEGASKRVAVTLVPGKTITQDVAL